MGPPDSVIETGVDQLVALVKKQGRVSFQEAAKELGVSAEVIGEWADFLEDENIVSVEYKLTKPYLTERKISKKEVESKVKEFSKKKEIFVRKAEGTLSFLQREAENMSKVKTEFDRLKKELGIELDSVRKELDELEEYESEERELAKRVLQEKEQSRQRIQKSQAIISQEQKRFSQVVEQIRNQEKGLEKEKNLSKALEQKEQNLINQLEHIKDMVTEVEEKVVNEQSTVRKTRENINRLHATAEEIKNHIEEEKDILLPLVKKRKEQEETIKKIQELIIQKVMKTSKDVKSGKEASKKFKNFFGTKMKVAMTIDKLEEDRKILEKDLEGLVKKARAFQLTSKARDLGKEIKEMEGKFKEVERKKASFEDRLRKVNKMIKK